MIVYCLSRYWLQRVGDTMVSMEPVKVLSADVGQIVWLVIGLIKAVCLLKHRFNYWRFDNKMLCLIGFGKRLRHNLLQRAKVHDGLEWGRIERARGSAVSIALFHARRCSAELMHWRDGKHELNQCHGAENSIQVRRDGQQFEEHPWTRTRFRLKSGEYCCRYVAAMCRS